jgi:hypothetical protein
METLLDRVKAAASKAHKDAVVEVSAAGVVEVLLPEDGEWMWAATEGTLLVAEDYDGNVNAALRMTLDDIKRGILPSTMKRTTR